MKSKSMSTRLKLGFVLLLFTLSACADLVCGSHFRYGTLSWQPTDTYVGSTRVVEFTFKAAFRKNYSWGSHHGEQWAQTNSVNATKVFYGSEGTLKGLSAGYDSSQSGCNLSGSSSERMACYKCPEGSKTNVVGCENSNPQYDRLLTDSNGNGVAAEKFYLRFPSLKQNDGSDIVQCPDPFHCDISKAVLDEQTKVPLFTKTDNSAQRALCSSDNYLNNPTKDASKCAPWDEVYGMFMGDGTSKTIEFEVSYIHDSDNHIVGNYLLGQSKFQHAYPQDTNEAYLAYFTGGDRAYECDYPTTPLTSVGACTGLLNRLLQNNQEGRYRLETTVKLKTGVRNHSPVAAMIPILPIPITSITDRARFQVTAYDPDGDALTFRFGSTYEMGGIVRSKTDAFPWSTNPDTVEPYDSTTGEMKKTYGVQYGRFHCDETSKQYLLNGKCPADRVPQGVLGMDVYSFKSIVPGLIEWNTWRRLKTNGDYESCIESKSGCEKMPQGLYNVVVIVSDGNSKVPIDFMVYLYDGQMHFCNKYCKDNKKTAPNPVDVTQNSYSDNYQGTTYTPAYPGVQTFADKDGIYGADFLVEGTALRFAQSCTICGIGSSNSSACTPVAADNQCGVTSLGSIVPATGACIINQPPKFVSDGTISISPTKSITDSPGLAEFNANKVLGSIGALDGTYTLPQVQGYYGRDVSFSVTAQDDDDCSELLVESTIMPDGAYLEDAEYLVNYDAFPNGQKVRKKFKWPANGDASSDTRAEKSKACFYAFDKYLVTATPFYCVEIVLKVEPPKENEVLLRFDCKLSLNWNELLGRFVIVDELSSFYSSKTYDGFMWHHVMVSLDTSGKGSLYIDGQLSGIDINVGTNVEDVATFNNGTSIGTGFSTMSYPNKCLASHSSGRRLAEATGVSTIHGAILNKDLANSDYPVNDGLPNATLPTGDCCTFKIAQKCSIDNSTRTFEGLVDEIAIWNRDLSGDEVQEAMFNMPSSRLNRKLIAPLGVQVDVTAGRTLWARFNNPCLERSSGINDLSGSTAGTIVSGTNANVDITFDSRDDSLSWKDFKTHSKYVYTGVPWLPPYIRNIETASDISIDGGDLVTVSGLGFARSTFLKCVNSFSGTKQAFAGGEPTRVVEGDVTTLTGLSKSNGAPVSAFDSGKPYLYKESLSHPTMSASRTTSWDILKNAALKKGRVPVFEDVPSRSAFHGESMHGSWEVVQCNAPKASYLSFPSDKYDLSVSNDDGLTVTNLKPKTHTEYALVLDGTVALSADSKIVGSTYSMWFMIHETTLTFATLFSLSNGLGFTYEDDIVQVSYGTQKLGSLGSTSTSLNEWHHIAISIDNGRTRAFIDTQTIVDVDMPNIEGGYALQSVGNKFKGKIDEFKVFSTALEPEEVVAAAFKREVDMSGMSGYYRFNQNFLDFTGNTTISVIGKSNAQFASVGAPWEPVSVYSVSGVPVEVADPLTDVYGGEPLKLTGFNFAPSQWLNCSFETISSASCDEKIDRNTKTVDIPVGYANTLSFSTDQFPTEGSFTANGLTCPGKYFDVVEPPAGFIGAGGDRTCKFHLKFWTSPKPSQTEGNSELLTIIVMTDKTAGQDRALILYDMKESKFVYHDLHLKNTVYSKKVTSVTNVWHQVNLAYCEDNLDATWYFVVDSLAPTTKYDNLLGSSWISDLPHRNLTVTSCNNQASHQALDPSAQAKSNASSADVVNALAGMTVGVVPWTSARVKKLSPKVGSINGGTLITIDGQNFTETEDFRVDFGDAAGKIQSFASDKIIVESPAGQCGSQASVSVSQMGVLYDLGKTFEFKPSMEDLQNRLISHYTMDAPKYALGATSLVVFDVVSMKNGVASNSAAATNRDGILNSALQTDGLQIPAPSSRLSKNFTICLWLKIENPKDTSKALEMYGAWKMFCSVSNKAFYVNTLPATEDQTNVLSPIFGPLVTEGKFGSSHKMTADDVWIYDRELSPCEIAARYYTGQSSIEIGSSDGIEVTIDSESLSFEGLESWIYLDSIQGTHTIAASPSDAWGVGVEDGKVFLAISVGSGCGCTDSCYEKYVSMKATVISQQWIHVAVSYDKGKAMYFVDGILLDENQFGVKKHPALDKILVGRSAPNLDDATIDPLGGQMYDIRFRKAKDFFPYTVKHGVQCPPRDLVFYDSVYAGFHFNEGDGKTLNGYTSLDNTAVTLNSSSEILWVNATYDDATYADNTKVITEGLTSWKSGDTVSFAISSHTSCGKLRAHGGEKYTVTFQRIGQSTMLDASVLDTNDGNYHVSRSGLTCGSYRVTIISLSGFYHQVDMDVVSQGGSAENTVVSAVQSEQCFGAPFKMEIQAFDKFGCKSLTGQDKYTVKLQGPHDAFANVSYSGDGKYIAEFIPLAPGKFFAEFNISTSSGSEPIKSAYQCIDVCSGSSLVVDGVSGVEISEAGLPVDENSATELDMSDSSSGTLKAWINPTGITEGDAYIIVKQSASDAKTSKFVKGYTLKLSSDYTVMEGTIYAGLGKLANVTANITIGQNEWSHIAFTYEEENMKLFVDGEIVAAKKVEWGKISNFANPYTIPISIGQGFVGSIDEVTMLSVAQDSLLLKEQIYCPPIAGNYDDVILYLPFNGYSDDAKTAHPGYGRTCKPNENQKACLTGNVFGTATLSTLISPLTDLVPGAGTPGTTYTTMDEPPYQFLSSFNSIKTEFLVTGRDRCGFVYQKGESGAFGLQIEKETKAYTSTSSPGTEYPVTTYGEASSIFATLRGNEVSTCYSNAVVQPYVRGDVYVQSLSVDEAGNYRLTPFANSSVVQLGKPITTYTESLIPHRIIILETDKLYTAGATSTLRIEVEDSAGNKIKSEKLDLSFELTLLGHSVAANIPVQMHFEATTETYILTFKLLSAAAPSGYNLLFLHKGTLVASSVYPLVLNVGESDFRPVVADQTHLSGESRKFRAGHTTALHEGNLYIWGGADKERSYSSEMLVLKDVENSVQNSFLYQKSIRIPQTDIDLSKVEKTFPLQFTVNTKELFDAGRILPNCQDIMFTINGKAQIYFLDPDTGCNNEATAFYLKLSSESISGINTGPVQLSMLYGNPGMLNKTNVYMKPEEVFELYEDFESGTLGSLKPLDACENSGSTFTVTSDFSKYGKMSLRSNSTAGSGALISTIQPSDYFLLKAWFWDSNAKESIHFISPDYKNTCSNLTQASGTAVGTFTDSHKSKLCFGQPWESTSKARSAEWKLLEIVSSVDGMSIYVDGEAQMNASSRITLDKVLISAGDTDSSVLWDNVMVLKLTAYKALHSLDVVVEPMQLDSNTLATGHPGDKAVWEALALPLLPPARYGHSSVYYKGKKYIFGGERNTYLFNDVWSFDFDHMQWEHVIPDGEVLPSSRVMHSAVLSAGGKMLVYGGRGEGGALLSDMWEFDLDLHKWSLVANATAMGGRLGHSSSIIKGVLYVFGGEGDVSTDKSVFYRCNLGTLNCEDVTSGCPEAPSTTKTMADVGLGSRYQHTAAARDGFLYVFGGSDPAKTSEGAQGGFFSFHADSCEWEQVLINSKDVSREEHSAVMGSDALYIFGGHSGGTFIGSSVLAYLY